MIPAWKVRRELLRIWRQVTFLPVHPLEQLWFLVHPRLFPTAYETHDGSQPQTDAVAVFLIHQPDGLQETTLTTCRHLAAEGYTVHLVSNGPLGRAEIEDLAPLCGRIIVRPNLGYDFGGYRKAILDLQQSGRTPSRLLLLNDSIWFPVFRECDLLRRLQAFGADVAGPVYYDHRSQDRSHLQSYMMLFSRRALRSPAFRDFWSGYRMSNNKVRTIRNGEMRLTHACRKTGLTVAALRGAYEQADLAQFSQRERAAILAYDDVRQADQTLAWRTPASPPASRTLYVDYLLTNHPMVNFRLFDLPILKKDRGVAYRRQRSALLAAEAAGLRARIEPAVLDAIRARDATNSHAPSVAKARCATSLP